MRSVSLQGKPDEPGAAAFRGMSLATFGGPWTRPASYQVVLVKLAGKFTWDLRQKKTRTAPSARRAPQPTPQIASQSSTCTRIPKLDAGVNLAKTHLADTRPPKTAPAPAVNLAETCPRPSPAPPKPPAPQAPCHQSQKCARTITSTSNSIPNTTPKQHLHQHPKCMP